jgi:hypothetical protein
MTSTSWITEQGTDQADTENSLAKAPQPRPPPIITSTPRWLIDFRGPQTAPPTPPLSRKNRFPGGRKTVLFSCGVCRVASTRQNPDSAKSRFSTDFSDLEKISRYQGYSLLEASQSRRTPHRLKPLRWGFRNRRVCCNPMSRTQLSNNFSGFCTLNNVQL